MTDQLFNNEIQRPFQLNLSTFEDEWAPRTIHELYNIWYTRSVQEAMPINLIMTNSICTKRSRNFLLSSTAASVNSFSRCNICFCRCATKQTHSVLRMTQCVLMYTPVVSNRGSVKPKGSLSARQGFCWWSSWVSLLNIRSRIQPLCRNHHAQVLHRNVHN